MKDNWNNTFNELKCCVLIPTYNNSATLGEVIDGVLRYTKNVIVVNDGSTDATGEILIKYKDISIITLPKNRGKGNALRVGFKEGVKQGYKYAISIDSDGQHYPDDLPRFLKALKEDPNQLIIGARNMSHENVPGKSNFGLRFSNFWFGVETGISLPDTQSGYRLYPIKKLHNSRFYTRKFEFEIEVLVRSAWKGIHLNSIPIQVYYPDPKDRVTHFRPFRDFFRISVLNTVMVMLALLYFLPAMFFRNLTMDKLKKSMGSGEPKYKLATAVGFGVFMGIVPIWGYQMIAAATLAHFFRLNKTLVLVSSNISIPPMIPLIVFASFKLGSLFVAEPVSLNFSANIGLGDIQTSVIQYLIGSLALATAASSVFFIFCYVFVSIKRFAREGGEPIE